MNKDDFISVLMSMSDTEINNYIKENGKPPKKVRLYHLVDKDKYEYDDVKVIEFT